MRKDSAKKDLKAVVLIFITNSPSFPQNGDSPLHIASAMGRRKLARILLESGPDLRMRNQQGETSVDIAERKGHREIAELIR